MSLNAEEMPLPSPPRLEYGRTISYIFENPNWAMNALCTFLCQLVANVVPIVPQMVSIGYQFEVLDSLLATGGTRYTDFDANRLGEYLTRGLWPVLSFLIVLLIWLCIFIAVVLAVVFFVFVRMPEDASTLVFDIVALLVLCGGLIIALGLVATPIMLRAGIAQEFGAVFDFDWISDFLSKMWLEVVLSSLFTGVVILGLILVTCGLGLFPAGPLASFMSSHFFYQFYALYLSRGGTPIPIRVFGQPTTMGPPM